jgi:hypothetical protein
MIHQSATAEVMAAVDEAAAFMNSDQPKNAAPGRSIAD